MIVENVPPEFLMLEETKIIFSDDYRFIYMLMNSMAPLSISVYDVIYNKFVILLPDMSVTDLLSRHKGFEEDTSTPSILYVNDTTLLILFNENDYDEFLGTVLLIVVNLNFSAKSFSIVDSKLIKDCYSKARLVKSDDRFLIIHTFAVDTNEFEDGDQFLGYCTFSLHDDCRLEIHKTRTVFDYQNSGYLGIWRAYEKKLWCVCVTGRTLVYQLICFDLKERNPKAATIEIFKGESFGLGEEVMFQWSENLLLKYYESKAEFSYLDLSTFQWSKPFKRYDLESEISEFKTFLNFDTAFRALIFDKIKKQLTILPCKTPFKLLDIAWNTILNNGLLDELSKRKIVIYPQLF